MPTVIYDHGLASLNVYGIAFVVSVFCIVALLFRSGWRGDTGSPVEKILVLFGMTQLSDATVNGSGPQALPGMRKQTSDARIYAVMLASVLVWTFAISPMASVVIFFICLMAFWYFRTKIIILVECPKCGRVVSRKTRVCPRCEFRLQQNSLDDDLS